MAKTMPKAARATQRISTATMKTKAFTYMEMLVVLAIVTLMSALATPNFVAMRDARNLSNFKSRLMTLTAKARSMAIESGGGVTLLFDKDADAFKLTQD